MTQEIDIIRKAISSFSIFSYFKLCLFKGLDWRGGAIGNGEWTGARLTDVLKLAGFDEDKTANARHVIFEGLDHGPDMEHFNASIPIEKANDPRGDVILAYQMNGEDISRDHGYPIRDDCILNITDFPHTV